MLGIILLAIGLVGLLLTVLSLVGFEFGDFDVEFGDSGIGLMSVTTPFVTGFGLLAGGLMVFGDTGVFVALLAGLAAGIVLGLVAVAVLGYLVGSEEELPSYDLIGATVRIVEPVSDGRLGTAEVHTPIGSRHVTVTSDETLAHNDRAVIIQRIADHDGFHVSSITFDETTHQEGRNPQ
ncbi:hypothetical protein [Gordonia zhaorongruii]|uniref:hypothetical protein n=1 Tax=Gordonia zhaorongruii TaxID=2597659 RepID=UPI00104F4310|nr:hypothetical protein [Gordonia zhaorongruii]